MTTTKLSSARRRVRVAATFALAFCLLNVPGAAHAAIDPWPTYQPQTICSPTAKKGTLELARYLQKKYPGSGSYGISRACGSGGRSEHKEGRAFDWRVSVTNAKERGYAYNFIKRVRATDSAGNADALARRMGIMYIIWNDTIYSSSHNFAPRPYLNAGCRSKATCSTTLRHRNHVHISLTRAGGQGRTSWYGSHSIGGTGSTPAPTPTPTPSPVPPDLHHEDDGIPTTSLRSPVALDAVPGGTVSTRAAVRKGQTVKVTAYGVDRFGPGHQLVSDATCVWDDQTRTWRQQPRAEVKARYGDPELRVNGVPIFAQASCRGGQHVYSAKIVQKHTSRITVTMAGRDQRQGSVRVVLSRTSTAIRSTIPQVPSAVAAPAAETPIGGTVRTVRDAVRLDSREPVVWSDDVLEAGVDYQVTVSGTVHLDRGASSDGQCLGLDDRWEPQGSLDLYRPGATHGSLYLDGVRFVGDAPAEDPTGCQLHQHTMAYRPSVTGRVALRLWDPTGTRDNYGSLSVRFERVTPVPLPAPAPAETVRTSGDWTRSSETFAVSAADPAGSTSALRLRAGKTATILVNGRVTVADGTSADASCVADGWSWVTSLGLVSGQDLFDLYVDGQHVDWRSNRSGGSSCDPRHGYTTQFTATKNGPLRVALADLDFGDNGGDYTVTIVRN